jgi:hypothetical protein
MEIQSSFSVPDAISFEQAIERTRSLLTEMKQNTLTDTELERIITALVQTENGVRGFFVVYLSDDRPIADQPSSGLVNALRSSPAIVAEFLVKNLAMSTAMRLTHLQNEQPEMAKGSQQVQQRTKRLIELTQIPLVPTRLQQLQESIETGGGEYQTFLNRWQYSDEQRQAIAQQIQSILSQSP